jgi:hypothetical protein
MNEFEHHKKDNKKNKKNRTKYIPEEQFFQKKSIKQFKKRKEQLYEQNCWEDIEEWENYKK